MTDREHEENVEREWASNQGTVHAVIGPTWQFFYWKAQRKIG